MFEVGDRVMKNPDTWIPTEFDSWGRGVGVGEVVEVNDYGDEGVDVDVRWDGGRCYESPDQIIKIFVERDAQQ